MVRRSLRVGLWAALIVGAPFTLVQLWGGRFCSLAGQSPESGAGRALSVRPRVVVDSGLVLHRVAQFHERTQSPGAGTLDHAVAIPANGLLAYALIYGAFGLPPLDLLGAGLATTLVEHRHVHRGGLDSATRAGRSRNIACSGTFWRATGR